MHEPVPSDPRPARPAPSRAGTPSRPPGAPARLALASAVLALAAAVPAVPTTSGGVSGIDDVSDVAGITLEVTLDGLPNDDGRALFALFATPDGFPDHAESALARGTAAVVDGRARVVFEHVAPGDYALSALHDANGSGGMDMNLFGLPKEAFAVSNVVKGRPDWGKAHFAVAADASPVSVTLHPLRFF